MEQNRYKYLKIKSVKVIIVLAFLSFFFYAASMPLISFIDDNVKINFGLIRTHLIASRVIIAIGLTGLFTGAFYRRNDFNIIGLCWLFLLVISFAFSRLLLVSILSSEYWWLISIVGIFVGILSYVLNRKRMIKMVGLLSGVVSFLSTLYVSYYAYFLTMEPPLYPSVIYVKSFPNFTLWLGFVLFIFSSSYFLSKGKVIKHVIK